MSSTSEQGSLGVSQDLILSQFHDLIAPFIPSFTQSLIDRTISRLLKSSSEKHLLQQLQNDIVDLLMKECFPNLDKMPGSLIEKFSIIIRTRVESTLSNFTEAVSEHLSGLFASPLRTIEEEEGSENEHWEPARGGEFDFTDSGD